MSGASVLPKKMSTNQTAVKATHALQLVDEFLVARDSDESDEPDREWCMQLT